ncbi:MAG: hypothetical protein Q4F83_03490 [Eubacteriales bacterium]|nr:hypothetical protein [Eubacteriales bacterium]
MKGIDLMEGMSFIDDRFINEAESEKPDRIKKEHDVQDADMLLFWSRWRIVVASAAIICVLSIPVFAAAVPAFYEQLYLLLPATAQYFKPVQKSCEDNGIRMEVAAVHIRENIAEIYIAMQDLKDTRIDANIDLFDSYSIHTPFDCTGHCKSAGYDSSTETATFLVTIELWDKQHIEGDKLTFSVHEFLTGRQKYEGVIEGVDFLNVKENPATRIVYPRGLSGKEIIEKNAGAATEEGLVVLKPEQTGISPVDGIMITGIGYIEGRLHVQVYYEDVLKTDNHGSVALKNKGSGDMIICHGSASFFDEEKEGSYEDYIFTEIPAKELCNYELYGEFITYDDSVDGNWSVTVPLENWTNVSK